MKLTAVSVKHGKLSNEGGMVNSLFSYLLFPGVIFLATLSTGIWLSKMGKPLNPLLFNIHKLIALGTVIFTCIEAIRLMKTVDIQMPHIYLLISAILCVITLFVTGALMSAWRPGDRLLLTFHNLFPFLAAAATSGLFYLLVSI
jgi:hypothetical protein